MGNIYIVIAAKRITQSNGSVTLMYNDTSEKFIEDVDNISPTNSERYEEYLKTKYIGSDYIVVRSQLNVETNVDIDEMVAQDALNKLSQVELEALKNKIINNENN